MTLLLVWSRSLEHADRRIQEAWPKISADYHTQFPDRWLKVTCTYRSKLVQRALFMQGRAGLETVNGFRAEAKLTPILQDENRVVTWTRASKHAVFPSLALDLVVSVDPDGPNGPLKECLSWDDRMYRPLVELCRKHGLVSGGTFHHPDWCHVEVPA